MGAGAKACQMRNVVDAFFCTCQPPAGKLQLCLGNGGVQGLSGGVPDQLPQINRMIPEGLRHIFITVNGCRVNADIAHDFFAELFLWVGAAAQKLT